MSRVLNIMLTLVLLSAGFMLVYTARQVTGSRSVAVMRRAFHPVAHKGSGVATIFRGADHRHYLELKDLRTGSQSGLLVYLTDVADARDNETVQKARRLAVGGLQGSGPVQRFLLPAAIDVTVYRSITIWSPKYEVNFTTAPLRRVGGD